jgi:hypothetical protein
MKINQIMSYCKIYFVHPSHVVVIKNQIYMIGKKKLKMNKISMLRHLNNNSNNNNKVYPVSIIKFPRMFTKISPFLHPHFLISREMTKAVMTAQPGGTSSTMNTRQQATEADAVDERWKLTKQTSATSDHSPRRSIPKSLDRNTRRSSTVVQSEKDLSLSKKQQQAPLTPAQISELSQRLRRTNVTKSTPAEPLTPTNKLIVKEDSPPSASHSDSAKAKNRFNEPPSPAIIMYTSTGGTEHGKPPKTPRLFRTTTSRSDAQALARQNTATTTTRACDSEAISVPAATFAIKPGPQTIMSQWMTSLNDNFDDERSDNQHSAKWEDAHEKLQSITHDPSQYHPAVSSLSSPPVHTPLSPSNMNSLQSTAANHFQSPIVYTTVSNSTGHRPLLKNIDENSNIGTMNSYDTKENKRNKTILILNKMICFSFVRKRIPAI